MPLFTIILYLIVAGVLLYLVNMIPMEATIKQIINILVIIVIVLWVLSMFIPLGGGPVVGHIK